MNGAIAEPWLRTIKPPNKASIRNIGNSQYFFLARRNFQNSFKNAMAHRQSELVFHGADRVLSRYPVGIYLLIQFLP